MQVAIFMEVTADEVVASVGVLPVGPYGREVNPTLPPERSIAEAENTIQALAHACDFARSINNGTEAR